MPSLKKKTNTLCVVSFLIVLLGIGLYCIFKPATPKEYIQTNPFGAPRSGSESHIRTSIPHTNTNNIREPALPDDNIELIDT